MRFVRRKDPPAALAEPEFQRMRRDFHAHLSLPDLERRQTRAPDRHLPVSPSLLSELASQFKNRCAFCESEGALSVYRFRPPSDALPRDSSLDAPLNYGWLADVWQNLYPICTDCFPRTPNHFPVRRGGRVPPPTAAEFARYVEDGTGVWMEHPSEALSARPGFRERQSLLDPCQDEALDKHFIASSQGLLLPRTRRAQETIEHFRLNRASLVSARLHAAEKDGRSDNQIVAKFTRASPRNPPLLRTIVREQNLDVDNPGFVALLLLGHIRTKLGLPDPTPLSSTALSQTDDDEPDVQDDRWRLAFIEIENFKSIQSLKLEMPQPLAEPASPASAPREPKDSHAQRVARTPALLILGENAAGKSSILEAIALALLDPEALTATEQTSGKLLLHTDYMGASTAPSETGSPRQSQTGSVCLTFQSDTRQTLRRCLRMQPGDNGLSYDGDPLPADLPVFAYGAFRHYLDDQTIWENASRGVISLFRSDNLLSNPDKWLYSLHNRDLDHVVTALRYVFGRNSTFKYIEKDKTAKRCLVVTGEEGGLPADVAPVNGSKEPVPLIRTPLDAVSSGFRTILALVCDVCRWLMDEKANPGDTRLQDARAVVLIDEVEAHLHPRWKVQVMDGLRRALPGVTFIATTHDPLCLRGMNDGEVKVLARQINRDWQVPVRVEKLEDLPNVTLLTIDQLLTSEFFRLFDLDDPTTAYSTAALTDMLIRRGNDQPLTQADNRLFEAFVLDIDNSLPIGRSDVARLVQDAVAEFLIEKQSARSGDIGGLRDQTVRKIINALGAS